MYDRYTGSRFLFARGKFGENHKNRGEAMNRFSKILVVATTILGSALATADDSLDDFLAQTGVKEGGTAMREHPNWQPPRKILVYGGWYIDPELEQVSQDVEIVRAADLEEALQVAKDADAIIGSCNNRLVEAAVKASWVQISGAGVNRCVPTRRIANGEVVLTNMQKMSSPVIAEHAVAMILALARNLPQFINAMDSGTWHSWGGEVARGVQSVQGKTLLIAGLGGIGTEVARRAAALGMRVVATRRSSRDGPDFVDYVGLSDELFDLAAEADFVLNALPLTEETEGIFDARFFAKLTPGTHFISVSRGKVTSTDDLVAALQNGTLAGAALDVVDPEPLPKDHPLWQMDNVIITPHLAGKGVVPNSHYTLQRENLRRFMAGDRLLNVVDPARGY